MQLAQLSLSCHGNSGRCVFRPGLVCECRVSIASRIELGSPHNLFLHAEAVHG